MNTLDSAAVLATFSDEEQTAQDVARALNATVPMAIAALNALANEGQVRWRHTKAGIKKWRRA